MFLTRHNRNGIDNTFALMDDMRREFDRLLSDRTFGLNTTSARAPRGTFSETDTAYLLRVEVPGLAPEALEVRVEDGVLFLSGERADDRPEGFEPRRTERVRYRFAHSMPLPDTVDAERIDANLKDGLLTVTLPKAAKAEPRKIAVKAG